LGVGSGLGLFVLSDGLDMVVGLRHHGFGSGHNVRLALPLVTSVDVGLRSALDVVLAVAFVYDFYSWVGFLVLGPTVVNSCLHVAVLNVVGLRSALHVGLGVRLGVYVGLIVGSSWLGLHVTLGVGLSRGLVLNISSGRLVGVGIRRGVHVGCSRVGVDHVLVVAKVNRCFFLFKGSHVRIVIIIIVVVYLLRRALHVSLLRSIKEIILLLNLHRC
jgi:hypothetical protein